jgi:hypothetical protein
MSTDFYVKGPFEMPELVVRKRSKNVKAFWDEHIDIAKEQGCYIFGIRASRGIVPYYVGKTTKSFKYEAFQNHKIAIYLTALHQIKKGTAIMFFVIAPRKGTTRRIAELENFLIQIGEAKNQDILNSNGRDKPKWSIKNIIRSSGWPGSSEKAFKRMMNL